MKDVDFDRRELVVRQAKGDNDRRTMLPVGLVGPLREHLLRIREQHGKDLATGAGWVEMPDALDRKLPNAGQEWPWQWIFPATRTYRDRETGRTRRHHQHETVVQKAIGVDRALTLALALL